MSVPNSQGTQLSTSHPSPACQSCAVPAWSCTLPGHVLDSGFLLLCTHAWSRPSQPSPLSTHHQSKYNALPLSPAAHMSTLFLPTPLTSPCLNSQHGLSFSSAPDVPQLGQTLARYSRVTAISISSLLPRPHENDSMGKSKSCQTTGSRIWVLRPTQMRSKTRGNSLRREEGSVW